MGSTRLGQGFVLPIRGSVITLSGVVFNNVLEDGIVVSPEQRKTRKNVSYGKMGNAAAGLWDTRRRHIAGVVRETFWAVFRSVT